MAKAKRQAKKAARQEKRAERKAARSEKKAARQQDRKEKKQTRIDNRQRVRRERISARKDKALARAEARAQRKANGTDFMSQAGEIVGNIFSDKGQSGGLGEMASNYGGEALGSVLPEMPMDFGFNSDSDFDSNNAEMQLMSKSTSIEEPEKNDKNILDSIVDFISELLSFK